MTDCWLGNLLEISWLIVVSWFANGWLVGAWRSEVGWSAWLLNGGWSRCCMLDEWLIVVSLCLVIQCVFGQWLVKCWSIVDWSRLELKMFRSIFLYWTINNICISLHVIFLPSGKQDWKIEIGIAHFYKRLILRISRGWCAVLPGSAGCFPVGCHRGTAWWYNHRW